MGVPTREAGLADARIHCDYWNEGRKDEWVASWRTIAQGDVRMFDPVGTKEKHGLDHATLDAWEMFQSILRLRQIVGHVNGNEMAWANENSVTIGDEVHAIDQRRDLFLGTERRSDHQDLLRHAGIGWRRRRPVRTYLGG